MKKIFLIILLSISFLGSCSDKITVNNENTLTVATFNMEWLGDGIKDQKPRSEGDYRRFADIIKKTQADIICCQEVENMTALNKVLKYLDDFAGSISNCSGAQKVAFIYKKNINVEIVGDYNPVAIDPSRNRPGYVIKVKDGAFDFIMMGVHLKSTSRYDNTAEKKDESVETRKQQAQIISNWADSIITKTSEKDVIILGDYNDGPKRPKYKSLDVLLNNPNLEFLTKDVHSCGKYSDSYVIDNILVSKSALARFIKNSEHTFDITVMFTKEQLDKVSDHCPVIVQFDKKAPDND